MKKQVLIEWLVNNDEEANAWEVEGSLPEEVDTERDWELLVQHGIDVDSLPGRR